MTFSVDISKVRVGDEVTVRMKVAATREYSQWRVQCKVGDHHNLWLSDEDIISHRPVGLAVGDRVKLMNQGIIGKIKAIDSDMAWIRSEGGTYWSRGLYGLERAE